MIMKGLGELRYKESDRFKSISEGLRNAGVQVNTFNDDMEIIGTRKVLGGNTIFAQNDHRIAMSFNSIKFIFRKTN